MQTLEQAINELGECSHWTISPCGSAAGHRLFRCEAWLYGRQESAVRKTPLAAITAVLTKLKAEDRRHLRVYRE